MIVNVESDIVQKRVYRIGRTFWYKSKCRIYFYLCHA